jgi:His-Xaa-Ser system protein HxsD
MLWTAIITVDAQSYPLPVVQKTAYALADTLSILIQRSSEGFELLISPATPSAMPTEIAAKTLIIQALNDFALREQVLRETSGIRELLARTALKESGV